MRISSFFLSFLLHLCVFAAVFFWPAPAPLDLNRPVYQVSLVMGDPGGENLASAVLGARPPASAKPLASTTLADKSAPQQGAPDAPALPSNAVPTARPEPAVAPSRESQPVVQPTAKPASQPQNPEPTEIPQAPKTALPSQPPKPVEPPKPEPKPEPKAEPKPEPKAEPKPEPKAEPKTEPKPEPTPKPEPASSPKTDAPKPKRDALADALADAQKKAGPSPSAPAGKSGGKSASGSASRALDELAKQAQTGVGGGGGQGDGPGGGGIYDVYAGLVMLAIKPNWSMPTYSRDNLVVQVRIKLDPQGKVLDCSVERGSGRADFDASAVNAVLRTNVLPVPPTPAQQDLLISFNSLEMAGR